MIGSIQWMILLHMLRNSLFMGITAVKDLDVISGEFPESCFYVEKPLLSFSTSQILCRDQAGLPPKACVFSVIPTSMIKV